MFTRQLERPKKPSEARGATPVYLPTHTAPTSNPIEQLFAKLKAILRKIAAYALKNAAYTVDSLCKAISFFVLTKSPDPSAPHISPIQDMVNLNGKRSKFLHTVILTG